MVYQMIYGFIINPTDSYQGEKMNARMYLRKGIRGSEVAKLQKLLNKVVSPSPQLKIDGDFGDNTLNAVLQFQRVSKIKTDGIVGKKTWLALVNATSHNVGTSLPQNALADIAMQYIGVRETGKNRAGSSKKMLEIFNADDLFINGKTDGYPWCAAFVSLCVQKLCQQSPFFCAIIPPREPSVSHFLNVWAKHNNCNIFNPNDKIVDAVKGDIVVFNFSHIGIVESKKASCITTIEGNTNAAGSREGVTVARKIRSFGLVKAFIRLPMSTIGLDRSVQSLSLVC